MKIDRIYAQAYLRGLFDGEGTVGLYTSPGKKAPSLRRISICNTDLSILDHACNCLDVLNIQYRTAQRLYPQNPEWSVGWDILIYGRRNIILFCRYVGSASTIKQTKLKEIRKSYRKSIKRYGRLYSGPNYTKITQWYDEGLSLSEIGRRLGVTHETIRNALKRGGHPVMHYSFSEMAHRRWRK